MLSTQPLRRWSHRCWAEVGAVCSLDRHIGMICMHASLEGLICNRRSRLSGR